MSTASTPAKNPTKHTKIARNKASCISMFYSPFFDRFSNFHPRPFHEGKKEPRRTFLWNVVEQEKERRLRHDRILLGLVFVFRLGFIRTLVFLFESICNAIKRDRNLDHAPKSNTEGNIQKRSHDSFHADELNRGRVCFLA